MTRLVKLRPQQFGPKVPNVEKKVEENKENCSPLSFRNGGHATTDSAGFNLLVFHAALQCIEIYLHLPNCLDKTSDVMAASALYMVIENMSKESENQGTATLASSDFRNTRFGGDGVGDRMERTRAVRYQHARRVVETTRSLANSSLER
jgi:hypothetical protein